MAVPAHPAVPAYRHTYHESIIGHVPGNHSARGNKSIAADLNAANNGGIGAYRSAPPDQGSFIKAVTHYLASGIGHICQHAARSEKYIIFEDRPAINGDVVLNLAVASELHAVGNEHILAEYAISTDFSAGTDMAEMPDLGSGSDLSAGINEAAGMNKIGI
jgi:hypothetical protein